MPQAEAAKSANDRSVDVRLSARSVAPRVIDALSKLGYILREDETTTARDTARVWLVDTDRMDEVPSAAEAPDLRLLLITSPFHSEQADPRIVAQTMRPGRLGAVYAMIQRALEQTPRACPRIPTRLSARCIRSDRRSIGAVLSLSEGGCLLRTRETLRKGTKLDVQFALPDYGLVSTPAECVYMRRGDAGLSFERPRPDIRQSIAHFITLQLATQSVDPAIACAKSA